MTKKIAILGFGNPVREDDGVGIYVIEQLKDCLLYTSPSPRDATLSRMPSSA